MAASRIEEVWTEEALRNATVSAARWRAVAMALMALLNEKEVAA